MAGNAQPAWMRQSLPIKDQQIGRRAQSLQRVENHQAFTKGKQARYVGKGHRPVGDGVFQRGHFLNVQHHYGRTRHVAANTYINPGHAAHRPQTGLAFHLGRQFVLLRESLLG